MQEELDSLIQTKTWTLMPRPSHANIIGNKWVFLIKHNPDGSISRYKAYLVAKGFRQ